MSISDGVGSSKLANRRTDRQTSVSVCPSILVSTRLSIRLSSLHLSIIIYLSIIFLSF